MTNDSALTALRTVRIVIDTPYDCVTGFFLSITTSVCDKLLLPVYSSLEVKRSMSFIFFSL